VDAAETGDEDPAALVVCGALAMSDGPLCAGVYGAATTLTIVDVVVVVVVALLVGTRMTPEVGGPDTS
jgi:hypothetical protein